MFDITADVRRGIQQPQPLKHQIAREAPDIRLFQTEAQVFHGLFHFGAVGDRDLLAPVGMFAERQACQQSRRHQIGQAVVRVEIAQCGQPFGARFAASQQGNDIALKNRIVRMAFQQFADLFIRIFSQDVSGVQKHQFPFLRREIAMISDLSLDVFSARHVRRTFSVDYRTDETRNCHRQGRRISAVQDG